MSDPPAVEPGRDESPAERADRQLTELLQEVRVALTGVQILFAFLLTLPFSARFATVGTLGTVAYVVTLFASASASAFLIAPVSYHRQVFRQNRKIELVTIASRLTRAGIACLVVAIAGAVFVVMNVVIGAPAAVFAALAVGGLCGYLWYALPARGRR